LKLAEIVQSENRMIVNVPWPVLLRQWLLTLLGLSAIIYLSYLILSNGWRISDITKEPVLCLGLVLSLLVVAVMAVQTVRLIRGESFVFDIGSDQIRHNGRLIGSISLVKSIAIRDSGLQHPVTTLHLFGYWWSQIIVTFKDNQEFVLLDSAVRMPLLGMPMNVLPFVGIRDGNNVDAIADGLVKFCNVSKIDERLEPLRSCSSPETWQASDWHPNTPRPQFIMPPTFKRIWLTIFVISLSR